MDDATRIETCPKDQLVPTRWEPGLGLQLKTEVETVASKFKVSVVEATDVGSSKFFKVSVVETAPTVAPCLPKLQVVAPNKQRKKNMQSMP